MAKEFSQPQAPNTIANIIVGQIWTETKQEEDLYLFMSKKITQFNIKCHDFMGKCSDFD